MNIQINNQSKTITIKGKTSVKDFLNFISNNKLEDYTITIETKIEYNPLSPFRYYPHPKEIFTIT